MTLEKEIKIRVSMSCDWTTHFYLSSGPYQYLIPMNECDYVPSSLFCSVCLYLNLTSYWSRKLTLQLKVIFRYFISIILRAKYLPSMKLIKALAFKTLWGEYQLLHYHNYFLLKELEIMNLKRSHQQNLSEISQVNFSNLTFEINIFCRHYSNFNPAWSTKRKCLIISSLKKNKYENTFKF